MHEKVGAEGQDLWAEDGWGGRVRESPGTET